MRFFRKKTVVTIMLIAVILVAQFSLLSNIVLAQSVSVISGKLPVVYGSANINEFELNGSKTRFASSGSANMNFGYDESAITTNEFWAEKLAALTDADESTSIYIRPENTADKDRVILVYRFNAHTLSTLQIDIDATSKKSFKIYVAENRKDLFKNQEIYSVNEDNSKSFNINMGNVKSNYLAVVFENPKYKVTKIELLGSECDLGANLLKDKTPVMYAPAFADSFDYNWHQIHYGFETSEMMHGYTEESNSYKENWKEHVKKLTDGNFDNGLYIRAEEYGNSRRVVVVYELSNFYNLSGIKIRSENAISNYSIYLNTDRIELFKNSPVSYTFNNTSLVSEDGLGGVKTKYIGIVFENPSYVINEIEIYGTEFEQKVKGENVLIGKTPIAYASTDSGKYEFNWAQTLYNIDGSMNYGYTESLRPEAKTFWDIYTTNFTDGNVETSTYVQPERWWSSDWILMVYNIEDSIVDGFSIDTDSTDKKSIEFFASSDRASLFNKPVYATETYNSTIVDDGEIEVRAKYVGIVLKSASYSINEIVVNATPYIRPDYGTNLLEGKIPTTLYVADREYPLVPSGVELLSINDTFKALGNITDNDFSTYVSWTPWYSTEYATKDSRYIVTAFDIGDMATLDTLLIDSSLGGFDIYVADDFLNIFSSDANRVYSSGGDDLTSNGSKLDPNTNLKTGEQIIQLGGVKGRYFGIVITRTQPTDMAGWGKAQISEIQLFGTTDGNDYGENLLTGTEPVEIYRSNYDEYAVSQGNITPNGSTLAYTDGDLYTGAGIQFPNVGGYIGYDYGTIVMVYYLGGTCDINRFDISSTFYYGIGGVDVFVSDKYSDLLESSNMVYTTDGATATDKVYDETKNLGSLKITNYFDEEVSGRYIAFVYTRVSDSNVCGWGQLRLHELELYGHLLNREILPDTTIVDSKTGSTATFNYRNPDEKYEFAAKGIKTFRIVEDKNSSMETFNQTLTLNGFAAIGTPFRIEFLDSNGNLISNNKLTGENVTFSIKLDNDNQCFLGKLVNNGVSVVKFAAQQGKEIVYTTEEFDTVYALLKFNSTGSNIENYSDGQIMYITDETDFYTEDDMQSFEDMNISDFEDDTVLNTEESENKNKKTSTRKWVTVEYDDPLEWFWNIYDTFAANIWMLIACIGVFLLGIGAVIYCIIYCKKRRNYNG